MTDSKKPKKPSMNFLQSHYNNSMTAGDSHIEYVIINDLSEETAKELKRVYLQFYAKGKNTNDR